MKWTPKAGTASSLLVTPSCHSRVGKLNQPKQFACRILQLLVSEQVVPDGAVMIMVQAANQDQTILQEREQT